MWYDDIDMNDVLLELDQLQEKYTNQEKELQKQYKVGTSIDLLWVHNNYDQWLNTRVPYLFD